MTIFKEKNYSKTKLSKKGLGILLISLALLIISYVNVSAYDSSDPYDNEVIIKLKNSEQVFKIIFTKDTDIGQIIDNYKQYKEVEIAEPNQKFTIALEPLDTFFTQQTYLTQIQANRAWNEITRSPDVVIAIIDTGVDIDNPDLLANIWQNEEEIPNNGIDDDGNGYIDDINGWDFISESGDVKPKFDEGFTKIAMNHGTLVAGVAAAEGANDIGVAGVTWQAQIMPLRVLDGTGAGDTLAVTKAINYARDNGADIINLSFIGEGASETLNLAIEKAFNAGLLIVAAAGNELSVGDDMDINPRYPICHNGPDTKNWIIGVAAVDANNRKASFSNYGSKCIDVSAPGVRIFTTQFVAAGEEDFEEPFGGYWTGTSVATPQIAGLAALVKALNPDIALSEWQRLIIDNTDNIDASNRNTPWENKLGSGRINAFRTVLAAQAFSPEQVSEVNNFIVTGAGIGGGPHVRLFDLNGNVSLQFFAYEPDFAGGINTAVNDIDGDGNVEIVTAPVSGHTPEIKIFDRFGILERSFLAYDEEFTAGLITALGDVDGDGEIEIITAPNAGNSPHIKIFDNEGNLENEFFAYNNLFKGGVSLAVADIDFDKISEIITVPGAGTSPVLKIFDHEGNLNEQFMAGNPWDINGLTVDAWHDKIVVGQADDGMPTVKIYDRYGHKQKEWLAYAEAFMGGIRVQASDLNDDGQIDITTGPNQGGGPHLRIFDESGTVLAQWMAYNSGFRGGISIGLTKNNK